MGYAALSGDDVGNHSTAIGWNALISQNYATSTDSNNTAVGWNVGSSISTGIQNTLIGSHAGDALTDADYNVAIGMQALTADTLGSRSTAMGFFALGSQNFTTATDVYNTAVGYSAGSASTKHLSLIHI